MLSDFRPAQENWCFAALRAHLESTQLVGSGFRQPRNDGARRVGLDELFGGPKPLRRDISLNPHQLPVVQTHMGQAREVRVARRSNDNDLATCFDDGPHSTTEGWAVSTSVTERRGHPLPGSSLSNSVHPEDTVSTLCEPSSLPHQTTWERPEDWTNARREAALRPAASS